jgi:hypothetical protein
VCLQLAQHSSPKRVQASEIDMRLESFRNSAHDRTYRSRGGSYLMGKEDIYYFDSV